MINNLDQKISHAFALLANKRNAPELPSDWAVRFHDDTPVAGNPASFAWFASFQEVPEFILECLCFYNIDPGLISADALVGKVSGLSKSILSAQIDLETYKKELNHELAKICRIVWIGTLSELMQGDVEFAANMRAEYWETTEKENGLEKITDDELEEFVSYLENYDL